MIRHLPRCLALLLAFALAVPAQAQIYRYKDADGNTVVSDKPPPPGTAPSRVYRDGASAGSGQAGAAAEPPSIGATLADRELEFRKRQQEKQEKAAQERQSATETAVQAENCVRARRQLQVLESGERIATRNEAGEREFMEDGQRSAEIERARKYIAENCR